MSVGSFLKSLMNDEAMGDEIIAVQERCYRVIAPLYPGADPHMLLAHVWLTAYRKGLTDRMLQAKALSETMQCACVAPPNNIRALGLYTVCKDSPYIIKRYPRFSLEFAQLMAPVTAATANGTIEALYRHFNPHMAAMTLNDIFRIP